MTLPFDTTRPHHKKMNLTEERQLEILRTAHHGTLATVNLDGEPYCVPIGFAYDEKDGSLIFHTANKGQKISNIARDARVCFSIVGSSNLVTNKFSATFESLVLFGHIERIADEEESLQAAITFCSKFAPRATAELLNSETDEGTDMAVMMNKASEFMSMYRLTPYHISGKQRQKK